MDKKTAAIELFLICIIFASASFKKSQHQTNYAESYFSGLSDFSSKQSTLLEKISRNCFTFW